MIFINTHVSTRADSHAVWLSVMNLLIYICSVFIFVLHTVTLLTVRWAIYSNAIITRIVYGWDYRVPNTQVPSGSGANFYLFVNLKHFVGLLNVQCNFVYYSTYLITHSFPWLSNILSSIWAIATASIWF